MLLTFLVGFAANYFFDLPLNSTKKTTVNVNAVKIINQSQSTKKKEEVFALSPCEGKNQNRPQAWKDYRRIRKAVWVGVINTWIICGVLPETSQNEVYNFQGKVIIDVLINMNGSRIY